MEARKKFDEIPDSFNPASKGFLVSAGNDGGANNNNG